MPILVSETEMVEFIYEFEENIVERLYEDWLDTRNKNWKLRGLIDCEKRVAGEHVPDRPKGAVRIPKDPNNHRPSEVYWSINNIADIIQWREDLFAGRIILDEQ